MQALNNAEARAKRYRLWDTLTKDFGLAVDADGSKSHSLKHAFDGHQRWHTIGRHGSP